LRTLLSALFVTLFVSSAFVACGFDDFEVDFDTPPDFNDRECESDEDPCDEGDEPGLRPADGSDDHPVSTYPATPGPAANNPSNGDDSDEPEDSDEESEVEEPEDEPDTSPDLQCSDDPNICRFCGPPEDVVTDCSPGDSSFECQVFDLVNQERIDNGLNPVTYNATLAESAMIHAMDLSTCDYFAHDSLDGTTFFERCQANGYPGTCTGENIGGGQTTPQAVFDAWMASPGHRDNILYPHHDELGVAYYEGSGTYQRYWLKHFGRP
jgi:uncharacterized protein YkwD